MFLAYVLLAQAVFTSLIVTQHALAAGTPDFAFALCTSHENADGTTQKVPAKPLPHVVHCPACLSAGSPLGVLPETALLPQDFTAREIAPRIAIAALHLAEIPSPKRSQGPPLTA